MDHGLISRMLRALRLDATLYREVAGPGGDTRQAALVVALAAVGSGVAWSARDVIYVMYQAWDSPHPVSVEAGGLSLRFILGTALIAVLHVVAWPVWAGGLRLVGARLGNRGAVAPEFGQVARAVAFAQAPGVLVVLSPIPLTMTLVGADAESWTLGSRAANMSLVAATLQAVISAWVLVGTFLAVRQTLGLSNGRTLGTIFAVGVGSAVLLGMATVAIILVSKIVVTVLDLYPDWGDRNIWAGPWLFAYGIGIPAAHGLEFNLGLGLSGMAMNLVAPLAPALIP